MFVVVAVMAACASAGLLKVVQPTTYSTGGWGNGAWSGNSWGNAPVVRSGALWDTSYNGGWGNGLSYGSGLGSWGNSALYDGSWSGLGSTYGSGYGNGLTAYSGLGSWGGNSWGNGALLDNSWGRSYGWSQPSYKTLSLSKSLW